MTLWMSLKDVAEEVGVTPEAVRFWVNGGHLKAHRFGRGHIRILRTDWEDYIKATEIKISPRKKEISRG